MVSMDVIDREVLKVLIQKYNMRGGHECTFKVKNIDVPYNNYQKGRTCAKLLKCEMPLIEKINIDKKSPPLYRTRFGEIIEKIGKIPEKI